MRPSRLLGARRGTQAQALSDDGPTIKTLRTNSNRMRRLLWIVSFCKEEPALRRLAFWAQGHGAIAHPSLFVRYDEGDGMGYRLMVDRPVARGTTLLSIPLPPRRKRAGVLSVDETDLHPTERTDYDHSRSAIIQPEQGHSVSGTAVENDVRQLVHSVSRGVTDVRHPQHRYLSFLHDHYNPKNEADGGEEEDDSFSLEDDIASSSSLSLEALSPPPMPDFDPYSIAFSGKAAGALGEGRLAYHQEEHARAQYAIRRDADAYGYGTSLRMKGVPNAPYLTAEHFATSRAKAEHVRMARTIRELQQSTSFFNVGAVSWAMSMIMSRGVMLPSTPFGMARTQQVFIPMGTHDTTHGLELPAVGEERPSLAAQSGLKELSHRQFYTQFTAQSARTMTGLSISAATRREQQHQHQRGNATSSGAGLLQHVPSSSVETAYLSLVPLLDFCNHSKDPSAHYCVTFPGKSDVARHAKAVSDRRVRIQRAKALKRVRRDGGGSAPCSASPAQKALDALTPKGDRRAGTDSSSPRMLSQVVGVKGWHYWRPCVHLVTVKDLPKYGEVTLKYGEDGGLSYGVRDAGAKQQHTDDGFLFRYGFRPSDADGQSPLGRQSGRARVRGASKAGAPSAPPSLAEVAAKVEQQYTL